MGRYLQDAVIKQSLGTNPIAPISVHRADGCAFIGVRKCRNGTLEIVYHQFGVRMSVWEVIDASVGLDGLQEACLRAINADDCLSTLHAALANVGVRIECKEESLATDYVNAKL